MSDFTKLIVCTPSHPLVQCVGVCVCGCRGGGVEPPTKFSKMGGGGGFLTGLPGSQFLERGCWERGGDFFQEGFQLLLKTKKNNKNLKYLTTKNVHKQKCFPVAIKNLN